MAENGTTLPGGAATEAFESKGKGKVAAEEPVDARMEEDDEDEEEEEGEDAAEEDDDEEDGMDEIDTNNILDTGRRTRGRVIDFAKAAEENPADDDEDEDEDDDFEIVEENEDTEMKDN